MILRGVTDLSTQVRNIDSRDVRHFVKPAHQICLLFVSFEWFASDRTMGLVDGAVSVHANPLLDAELAQRLDSIHSFFFFFVHCLRALKEVNLLVPVWICTFSLLPCALSGYDGGTTKHSPSVRNLYCAIRLLSLDLE